MSDKHFMVTLSVQQPKDDPQVTKSEVVAPSWLEAVMMVLTAKTEHMGAAVQTARISIDIEPKQDDVPTDVKVQISASS